MKKIFVLVMLFAATLFCEGGAWTNYPVATNLNGSETFLFGTATNNKLIVASNLFNTALNGPLYFSQINLNTANGSGGGYGANLNLTGGDVNGSGNGAGFSIATGNAANGKTAGSFYFLPGSVSGSGGIAGGYVLYLGQGSFSATPGSFSIIKSTSYTDTDFFVNDTSAIFGVPIVGNGISITNILHLTTSTATSGTVTAVTNYQSETIYLSNSSTISSITIALPTTTITGQTFRIHSKSAVTTLSITGTSFADSAVTSLTAGQTIGYQAQNASGAYIRIQ
jgi:hypothetical protein